MQTLEHHFVKKCLPSGKVERLDWLALRFGSGSVQYSVSLENSVSYFKDIRIILYHWSPEDYISPYMNINLSSFTMKMRDKLILKEGKAHGVVVEDRIRRMIEKYVFDGSLTLKAKYRL